MEVGKGTIIYELGDILKTELDKLENEILQVKETLEEKTKGNPVSAEDIISNMPKSNGFVYYKDKDIKNINGNSLRKPLKEARDGKKYFEFIEICSKEKKRMATSYVKNNTVDPLALFFKNTIEYLQLNDLCNNYSEKMSWSAEESAQIDKIYSMMDFVMAYNSYAETLRKMKSNSENKATKTIEGNFLSHIIKHCDKEKIFNALGFEISDLQINNSYTNENVDVDLISMDKLVENEIPITNDIKKIKEFLKRRLTEKKQLKYAWFPIKSSQISGVSLYVVMLNPNSATLCNDNEHMKPAFDDNRTSAEEKQNQGTSESLEKNGIHIHTNLYYIVIPTKSFKSSTDGPGHDYQLSIQNICENMLERIKTNKLGEYQTDLEKQLLAFFFTNYNAADEHYKSERDIQKELLDGDQPSDSEKKTTKSTCSNAIKKAEEKNFKTLKEKQKAEYEKKRTEHSRKRDKMIIK